MVVSRHHGFVFVHNPKTGGVSITKALKEACPDAMVDVAGRHSYDVRNFPDLYSFSFVRNPYTRMVSAYEFFKQRPHAIWHRHVLNRSFREWLHQGPNPTWFELQSQFADGCSFVGRFERLAEDFSRVCEELGLAAKLGHHQNSKVNDYWAYYDRRSREIVESYYAEDFSRFEYGWGG